MAKTKREIYVVEWDSFQKRWVLVWWDGKKRKETVRTARQVGETKRKLVKFARAYMREATERHKVPRQLLVRDRKGRIIDEASYDCDSAARG